MVSVTARHALRDPLAAGVNVTLKVQLAPADRLFPQVLVSAKSPGSVPVMEMLVMLNDFVPTLVRVTVWAVLVVPTL